MTKEEVKKIQRLESHAWDLLCEEEYEYVKANFPFGYGYEKAQLTNYILKNNGLHALLYSWHAFSSVMEELRIPTAHSARAVEYGDSTMNWLRGVDYDFLK